MNGAKGVIEALKDERIHTIFGIPGGAMLPFYDELQKDGSIRHIHMRHEQGGVHAAEGYARVLGQVGVCVATSGPGATNLVTGIADAFMDSVPVVALTGQVPQKLLGKDAFQEIDFTGITVPITKQNFRLTNPDESYATVRDAFRIAISGRPGPVVVDLPKDTMAGPSKSDKASYRPAYNYAVPELDRSKIKQALEMLFNAERPMILAGGGITIANAQGELVQFAEVLMGYVVTTITAMGAVPSTHPLCLGMIGMHGRQVSNHAVANCDVLLAIGTRLSDRITGDLNTFAPNAKIIHIDIDKSEINKNVPVHLPIIADAKEALQEMLRQTREMQLKGKDNLWRKRLKELNVRCTCNINHDKSPVKPETIMRQLNEALPKDIIITTEVGHHQMFAAHFLKVHNPRHYISSAGLGTMGFGLPAALGAKIAKPNHPVIDVSGDGSLLMICQEMATGVEFDIPVVVACIDNGWYAIVKQWQKTFYEERYIATNLGKGTDFVKLAESFGARATRVTRPSEIPDAVKTALKSDRLYLIDIMTDPDESGIPLVPPLGKNTEMILGKQCPKVCRGYFDESADCSKKQG